MNEFPRRLFLPLRKIPVGRRRGVPWRVVGMSDEDGRNEEFRARRGLKRAGGLDLNWKLSAHTLHLVDT